MNDELHYVLDANENMIRLPGKVLVLRMDDLEIDAASDRAMVSVPFYANVEALLPNGFVVVSFFNPGSGSHQAVVLHGTCLEWVPR